MITETVCFTGHRWIPSEKRENVSSMLFCFIQKAYDNGYRRFMCGGALGFDTLAALQVLELRRIHPEIKLVLAIPCGDQAAHWNRDDQEVYSRILDQADEKKVLSPFYYHGCMQTRNRYMVDHSNLCICYMYSLHGGTAYTVRYANSRNIEIINLAMNYSRDELTLKENQWNSIFISRSARKSAGTVHLCLSQTLKLRQKNMLNS